MHKAPLTSVCSLVLAPAKFVLETRLRSQLLRRDNLLFVETALFRSFCPSVFTEVNECSLKKCSQGCYVTTNGSSCYCNTGFRLMADAVSCVGRHLSFFAYVVCFPYDL